MMDFIEVDAERFAADQSLSALVQDALVRSFPERSICRVLLVTPPDIDAGRFEYALCKSGRYANYPAYGPGLIASHLRNAGIEVEVVQLNHVVLRTCRESVGPEEFDFDAVVGGELARVLQSFRPDIAGVSCMFSLTHRSAADTCARLRALAPGLPLALGGVHVTNAGADPTTREAFLKDFPAVDFFFFYESELAFRDFVRVVNRQARVAELGQVLVRADEAWLYLARRKTPRGEDIEIAPAHDQLSLDELSQHGKIGGFHYLKEPHHRFATVLSNRGCRGHCTFCSVRSFNGAGVRVRSVQSLMDELLLLRERFGVEHVIWLDDDFLYDRRHALALFNEMARRKIGITWDCSNGVIAAACTDEVIAGAAESGCIGLVLGMESGNPAILRQVRKPGTVQNYLKAAEVLRRYESINSRVFLMIGFPGETFRMLQDTVNVAREMDLDWYIIQAVQPLPNTEIFRQLSDSGEIDPARFDDVRYTLGYYGKLKDEKKNVMTTDFDRVFELAPPDSIASPAEMNRVWAYMNYHLNFRRLFDETRPAKLDQLGRWLEFVGELVTPDGAIVQYFRAYVHKKLSGSAPPEIVRRLRSILQGSADWRERLAGLELSPDDLECSPTVAPRRS